MFSVNDQAAAATEECGGSRVWAKLSGKSVEVCGPWNSAASTTQLFKYPLKLLPSEMGEWSLTLSQTQRTEWPFCGRDNSERSIAVLLDSDASVGHLEALLRRLKALSYSHHLVYLGDSWGTMEVSPNSECTSGTTSGMLGVVGTSAGWAGYFLEPSSPFSNVFPIPPGLWEAQVAGLYLPVGGLLEEDLPAKETLRTLTSNTTAQELRVVGLPRDTVADDSSLLALGQQDSPDVIWVSRHAEIHPDTVWFGLGDGMVTVPLDQIGIESEQQPRDSPRRDRQSDDPQ